MRKITGTIIILLWAILFAGLTLQFFRMTTLNKINTRIIKLYQVKSSLPKEFKAAEDSLSQEITKLLDRRENFYRTTPLKFIFGRSIYLQIYLFTIAILTFFWLLTHYRKQE